MVNETVAPRILAVLSAPENVGRWLDTRAIAHEVFDETWASPEQIKSVRQSLRKLHAKGRVERFGFFAEWRLAGVEEREPPAALRYVMGRLKESEEDSAL